MTTDTDRENARKMLEQLATLPLAKPAKAAPVLPPVSPPFICEDDAANWFHQHERAPDKEYGSLILQRPDGKFVATTPISDQAETFDFALLLAYDPDTRVISHPVGYRCVGKCHSHPDISEWIATNNRSFNENQVKLLNSLPSQPDLYKAFNHRDFYTHNYVSGPFGSLVAYSMSPPENPSISGFSSRTTPEKRIMEVLAVGQMRVLHPGTVWGGFRGRITSEWIPYQPVIPGPPTLQPFYTSVFEDPASALSSALSRVPATVDHQRVGFILKRRDREEYVATLPFHQPDGLLAMEQVFPAVPGGFRLPESQTLAGVYLGPESLATPLPEKEADLYQQFFSPQSLVFSVQQARESGLVDSSVGYSVFRQTPDGALLKYHSTFSEAEAWVIKTEGAMGVNIDKLLLGGHLSAKDFVLSVAVTGVLTVEKSSPLWDVGGVVGSEWLPYAGANRITTDSE
ncbi:DUF4329 domain-containing protein [Pseudomonas sp. ACN8]|uniref:DUF4329 domain-containing protein n=1 Tax=Pseudomonas sp. ACN8 TaxID=1920428 RepID=UPI000BB337FE|nr:DUF4329 domain-containing protein [Pseudomonas sp. ACN8]